MTKELQEFIDCKGETIFNADQVANILGVTKMELGEVLRTYMFANENPFISHMFIKYHDEIAKTIRIYDDPEDIRNDPDTVTLDKCGVILFAMELQKKYPNCKFIVDSIKDMNF